MLSYIVQFKNIRNLRIRVTSCYTILYLWFLRFSHSFRSRFLFRERKMRRLVLQIHGAGNHRRYCCFILFFLVFSITFQVVWFNFHFLFQNEAGLQLPAAGLADFTLPVSPKLTPSSIVTNRSPITLTPLIRNMNLSAANYRRFGPFIVNDKIIEVEDDDNSNSTHFSC